VEHEEQVERQAEELEREADKLERESDRVGAEIVDARRDWERKQEDAAVPGAQPDGDDAENEERDDG
jgi:hypothetical protein